MNEKKILEFFNKINISKRYVDLCNNFSDFENSKTPNKNEVLNILNKNNIDLKYSKQDKIFYENIKINEDNYRFYISVNYGIIASVYMIWNEDKTILNNNSYEISEKIDDEILEKIKHRFPIATSEKDLEEILEEILDIYKGFKREFIEQHE